MRPPYLWHPYRPPLFVQPLNELTHALAVFAGVPEEDVAHAPKMRRGSVERERTP